MSCSTDLDCPASHCCLADLESVGGTCTPLRQMEQICMTSSFYEGMSYPMCPCATGLSCSISPEKRFGICTSSWTDQEEEQYNNY